MGLFSIILTVFVMGFVDTTGTLLGLAYKSGLLDESGNLPDIQKPMLCDAVGTVAASLLGTTTSGAFIESAAGIKAGGRSGFASVVTAFLFLLALFFAPFMAAVPAFVVIILMSFTYNLGIGITAGFVVYPLVKLFAGRVREIHSGMWILAALSALFFIFYPY